MHFSFQPSKAQQALASVCLQDTIPLDEALYWIAQDEDPHTPNDTLAQLDQIANQIHLPDPSDVLDSIVRINHHLFYTLGFQGDTEDYYHPRNSQIHQVLARKRGLPILLGVLYIEIAKRLHIPVQGIGFPRHFLVQPTTAVRPFFIDPFDKGNILNEEDLRFWHEQWGITEPFEECIQPSSSLCIVLRMCHNLFYAHRRLQQNEGMLRSLERMMVLQPKMTQLHRTHSIVLGHMKRFSASIEALEQYMLYHPEAPDIVECQQEMAVLKKLASKS